MGEFDAIQRHELTFRNPFKDSLVFVLIPNDGRFSEGKKISLLLSSDSVVSLSRDDKEASHILNFIFLKPEESYEIELFLEGEFDLLLEYEYFLVSEDDYQNNKKKRTKKHSYRKEMNFIKNHKLCKQSVEIFR